MDSAFIISRLAHQIRQLRINRGLTQAELGRLARITRQKVIAVEQGSPSVGMASYAQVLAALDCELEVIPATMPTLDEIQGIFD